MADNERAINWFMEPMESPTTPAPWVLLPTPGFTQIANVPQAPIRGMFSQNGRVFFVAGFAFYEMDPVTYVTTLRGSVAADGNPVTMCSNGDAGGQLFLTSAGVGYLFDLNTSAFTTVLASGATMGDYLDGYFLALDATTSTFRISNLLDGSTWNPAQVAQRTAGADRWVAMKVCNRLIYLIGEQTSEVWWNAGTFPFPFQPIQEAFMQQGTTAPWSLAVITTDAVGSLCWVTGNAQGRGMVVRTNGYVPGRISNHALEFAIENYADIEDALACCYQEQGHSFYVLTFPTGDQTWAFDTNTSLWHERAYWDVDESSYHAQHPIWFCSTTTQNLAGDRDSGRVHVMSQASSLDEYGSLIRRMRQPPRLSAEQKRFVVNSFQIVLDVGLGLVTGQGSDPQLMLRVSMDGGRVFGNERWVSGGKIGAFSTRARWTRLGQGRNFVPQVVVSDPIPWRLVEALVDVSVGVS